MERLLAKRKRSLLDGFEEDPPVTKKCLANLNNLLDRYQDYLSNKDTDQQSTTTHGLIKVSKDLTGEKLLDQLSSWVDTQHSADRVLWYTGHRPGHNTDDIHLKESINKKFLKFHQDIIEECGAEDRQHSWAVIEKQEEVLMYGPYYPNYNIGEHSEDIIIKQTQGLLQTEGASEDWKLYVFTVNSPCLARNSVPCMLNLVQKAREWYRLYGVKTHIGYVKCWGFKGSKENLFHDINYCQLDCIDMSLDYACYVQAAHTSTDNGITELSENLYNATKRLLMLGQEKLIFPLTTMQERQWKSCFKDMYSIETDSQSKKELLNQEINIMIEAGQLLVSGENKCLWEYLERGKTFAREHVLNLQLCDSDRNQMRLTFHQCWGKMVKDRYANFIMERLTEDFNQCTIQLFTKEMAWVTEEYLQMGKIRFLNSI